MRPRPPTGPPRHGAPPLRRSRPPRSASPTSPTRSACHSSFVPSQRRLAMWTQRRCVSRAARQSPSTGSTTRSRTSQSPTPTRYGLSKGINVVHQVLVVLHWFSS